VVPSVDLALVSEWKQVEAEMIVGRNKRVEAPPHLLKIADVDAVAYSSFEPKISSGRCSVEDDVERGVESDPQIAANLHGSSRYCYCSNLLLAHFADIGLGHMLVQELITRNQRSFGNRLLAVRKPSRPMTACPSDLSCRISTLASCSMNPLKYWNAPQLSERGATPDLSVAREVVGRLRADGHDVFLDRDAETDIRAGEQWRQRLYDELRRVDAVISVVTSASAASMWCAAGWGSRMRWAAC
jgi:TIR domain